MSNAEGPSPPREPPEPRETAGLDLTEVREALRNLRFGAVEIIVQDGMIVQINRTEKRRFDQQAGRH